MESADQLLSLGDQTTLDVGTRGTARCASVASFRRSARTVPIRFMALQCSRTPTKISRNAPTFRLLLNYARVGKHVLLDGFESIAKRRSALQVVDA